VRLLAPSGERFSGSTHKASTDDGAEQINREGASVILPSSTPCAAATWLNGGRGHCKVEHNVKLPPAITGVAGEYASQKRADKRMALVIPITVWHLPHSLHHVRSYKCQRWCSSLSSCINCGPLALFLTHTNFSVSSEVASWRSWRLSGNGLIMIEFINQLRARRKGTEGFSEDTS